MARKSAPPRALVGESTPAAARAAGQASRTERVAVILGKAFVLSEKPAPRGAARPRGQRMHRAGHIAVMHHTAGGCYLRRRYLCKNGRTPARKRQRPVSLLLFTAPPPAAVTPGPPRAASTCRLRLHFACGEGTGGYRPHCWVAAQNQAQHFAARNHPVRLSASRPWLHRFVKHRPRRLSLNAAGFPPQCGHGVHQQLGQHVVHG